MAADEHPDTRPVWDDGAARRMVGGVVVIGITRIRGDEAEQEQMYGVLLSADPERGFEIALSGSREGETFWLPPDMSGFEAARPGEYRLKSTGETVTDPDFVSIWTISAPSN